MDQLLLYSNADVDTAYLPFLSFYKTPFYITISFYYDCGQLYFITLHNIAKCNRVSGHFR